MVDRDLLNLLGGDGVGEGEESVHCGWEDDESSEVSKVAVLWGVRVAIEPCADVLYLYPSMKSPKQ